MVPLIITILQWKFVVTTMVCFNRNKWLIKNFLFFNVPEVINVHMNESEKKIYFF